MPGDTLGSQSHKKHQAIWVCWDLMSTDQHMAQHVVLGAVVSLNAPVSSVICVTQLQEEMGLLKCLTLLQIKLDSLGAQEPHQSVSGLKPSLAQLFHLYLLNG